MNSYTSPTTKILYRGTQVVWYVAGIAEALLALRLVMKLLAANTAAAFTGFIYNTTQPLVAPFLNVFRVTYIEGAVFEWTTLLAMFVYWLIAVGIVKLLLMSKSVSTPEAAVKLSKQEP